MAPFYSLVEDFEVQADPQLAVGFSCVCQVVDQVCCFQDLPNDSLFFQISLSSCCSSSLMWMGHLRGAYVYDMLDILVLSNSVLGLEVSNFIKLIWLHLLYLFFERISAEGTVCFSSSSLLMF